MRYVISTLTLIYCLSSYANNPDQLWRFNVLTGDREIGTHTFRLTAQDGKQHLSSEASFNVKVLFVNVFSYDHRSDEHWQGNCLERIESTTRANKKRFAVNGARKSEAFVVTNLTQTQELPSCVQTFAYWNPTILEANQLLNAQTGELESINVSYTGQTSFKAYEQTYPARQYRINLEKGYIDLWYHADSNVWLGLETMSPDKRIVRYVPEHTPQGQNEKMTNRQYLATESS